MTAIPSPGEATNESLYDRIGEEPFRRIVHGFYQGVAEDPELRAMYPEQDLGPAEDRLRMFLLQYWGGPRTYSEQRGHPRLRMRHVPYRIGRAEHDAWLSAMQQAISESSLTDEQRAKLWSYLVMAAGTLVNSPH